MTSDEYVWLLDGPGGSFIPLAILPFPAPPGLTELGSEPVPAWVTAVGEQLGDGPAGRYWRAATRARRRLWEALGVEL